MTAAEELGREVGVVAATEALEVSRATLYRRRRPAPAAPQTRPTSHRALTEEEQARMIDVLNSERYADKAPAEVHATLPDEGTRGCTASRAPHRGDTRTA